MKRLADMDCTIASLGPKKPKTSKNVGYSQQWKFWVLAHYEFSEDSITSTSDIINCSNSYKENIPSPLDSKVLGRIISDLWNGRVQPVRRGPRNKQQRVYLNLRQKIYSNATTGRHDVLPSSTFQSLDFKLPTGWKYEVSLNDVPCFYRREQIEFNGQRVCLELMVDMSLTEGGPWSKFKLRSRGLLTDLEEIIGGEINIIHLHLTDQVQQVIQYLEGSLICRGIPLKDDESIIAMNPHLTGQFTDLSDPTLKTETRVFSMKCQVISTGTDSQCKNCKGLKKVNNQRKSRKEKRPLELPATNCNKRFLSKEEVVEQLKDESRKRKNAESRENYWKEKFASEALELDNEDQTDLAKIFAKVKNDDVPADMVCLWEQQAKILQSNSPQGYRWHPKYVI